MDSNNYEVVLLGHFALDNDIVDGVEKELIGSAVYYGAFALRSIGVKVAVVTKLAQKDFPLLSIFRKAGVKVFAMAAPETTGLKNIYSTEDPDNRKSYSIGFAGHFQENDFPELKSKIIHIGSLINKEVSINMMKKLSKIADLSLDVQGYVRVKGEGEKLISKDWEEKEEILPYIKYLKADIAEATILSGTSDLHKAAKILSQLGAKEILLTHKEGVLLYAGGEFYQAPFSPKSLKGRSGRGDTCICTYIGKRLTLDPYPALCFAAALTTKKLEKEGPFKGDLKDVEDLLEKSKIKQVLI